MLPVAVGDARRGLGHLLDRPDAETHDPPGDRAEHHDGDRGDDDLEDDEPLDRLVDAVLRDRDDGDLAVRSGPREHPVARARPVLGSHRERFTVGEALRGLVAIDSRAGHLLAGQADVELSPQGAVGADEADVDVRRAIRTLVAAGWARPGSVPKPVGRTGGLRQTGVELVHQVVAHGRRDEHRDDDEHDDDDAHPGEHSGAQGQPQHEPSASPADRVADAADRGDQLRLGRVHLASEVADVGLDDAAVATEVVLPDVVEDLRLGHHPALVDE